MAEASGFTWLRRKNGDVVISHHERTASVLRGTKATNFVEDVDGGDDQQLMARVTGNYKRGNERQARNHPRNRSR